jgi:chromosome segregation ATPase
MPCKRRSLAQKTLARNLVSYRWSNKENSKTASDRTNSNVKTRTQARISSLQHELAENREHTNLLQTQSNQQQKDLTYLRARLNGSNATLALVNDDLYATQMELRLTETTLNDSLQELQESHVLAAQHHKRIQRQQCEKKKLSASVRDLQNQVVSQLAKAQEASSLSTNELANATNEIKKLSSDLDFEKYKMMESHKEMSKLRIKVKRLQVRILRADNSRKLAKDRSRRLLKASKKAASWLVTSRRTYTPEARTLARLLSKAGCSQERVGPIMAAVGKALGVKVSRNMSRRTVQRANDEAAVAARIQMGYELANAEGKFYLISAQVLRF